MKKLMILFVLAALLMSGCAHSTIDESSTDSTLTSEELRIKEDLDMYDGYSFCLSYLQQFYRILTVCFRKYIMLRLC